MSLNEIGMHCNAMTPEIGPINITDNLPTRCMHLKVKMKPAPAFLTRKRKVKPQRKRFRLRRWRRRQQGGKNARSTDRRRPRARRDTATVVGRVPASAPPPSYSLTCMARWREGGRRGKRRTDAGLRGNMIRFIHDLVETEGLQ